jgi:hypothetical protein
MAETIADGKPPCTRRIELNSHRAAVSVIRVRQFSGGKGSWLKFWWMAIVLVMPVAWDSTLGPNSNYWKVQAIRGDPPRLPPSSRPPGTLRVLFIGNSLTRYWGGLSLIETSLALSHDATATNPPIFEQTTANGFDLQEHWDLKKAVARIREGNWDYVVLQDHSEGPLRRPEAFADYARRFDAEIKKVGAKTVLFMTWSRVEEPQQQLKIAEAYLDLGRQLNAAVVPVGLAFREAASGRRSLQLYELDGKHPSMAGSYLTACCFYSFFYGQSPAGLTAVARDRWKEWLTVAEPDARYLQDVAYRVVAPKPQPCE